MGEDVDLGIPGLGPATPLARGGFAQVYQAEQLSLRRTVAVKVLFTPPTDKVAFARFERECHALGAVSSHPNIVVVHDRGFTADGRPFITMEHRVGGSLADRLAEHGPLPAEEVRSIGVKIANALLVAHGAGVIHRDVKPANILLSAYGEPALADFGIARIDGGHKTTTGQMSASAAHASREVLSGHEPSAQSDIYSLGSTMLELCSGRTPFQRPGDLTVWQLINRAMTEDVPDPVSFGVPAPLAAVISKALSHDLGVRHDSPLELREELTSLDLSGHTPADAPSTGGPAPSATTEPTRTPLADPRQALSGPIRPGSNDPNLEMLVDLPGPPTPDRSQQLPTETNIAAAQTPATHTPPTQVANTGVPNTGVPNTEVADIAVAPSAAAPTALDSLEHPRRRWGRRVLVAALLAGLLGTAAWALTIGPAADLFADPVPEPGLDFAQALIEPLDDGRSYALSVRDAPAGAAFRLVVDDEVVVDEPSEIVVYTADPGRHRLAVEVIELNGTRSTTEAVDVYVSPGPPQGGYRVNLAAVRVAPQNWPIALRTYDELVADGHTELVLSPTDTGDFWNFYIDGYGDDSEAAWDYCEDFGLGPDDCFAADVPIEGE